MEKGLNGAGIFIQHKELAKVGTCGAQQVEPVSFGLGQGLFVAEDHVGRIILNPPQGDKAAPF